MAFWKVQCSCLLRCPITNRLFFPSLPHSCPCARPCAPGTPGKVVPIQRWDQYSCQALATLPLLIGITTGRLQLSLHLSVSCHNVIKISLSVFITEPDRSRGSHETTDSSRSHWGWGKSPSLPKLQLLDEQDNGRGDLNPPRGWAEQGGGDGRCGVLWAGVQHQAVTRGSHRLAVEVGEEPPSSSSHHPRLLPHLSHGFPPAARAQSEQGMPG